MTDVSQQLSMRDRNKIIRELRCVIGTRLEYLQIKTISSQLLGSKQKRPATYFEVELASPFCSVIVKNLARKQEEEKTS